MGQPDEGAYLTARLDAAVTLCRATAAIRFEHQAGNLRLVATSRFFASGSSVAHKYIQVVQKGLLGRVPAAAG